MKACWLPTSLCFLVFCSCAATHAGRQGHARFDWWPGRTEWRQAALNAARHPGTWVPVAGAAVIMLGGWDRGISDWAVEERPLFSSLEAAEKASDRLRSWAHLGMLVTAVAVPGDDGRWLLSTARRLAWEHLGVFAATRLTDPIKEITDRDRPNGGKGSFPSWHATRAACYAGMGYRNLDCADLCRAYGGPARVILACLVAGTAWAGVEAGQHYPTDVLAGAALGNFVAVLVHDALLRHSEHYGVRLEPGVHGGTALVLEVRF